MNAEFQKLARQLVADPIEEIQTEWSIDPTVIKAIDGPLRHAVKIGLGISCLAECWSGKRERDEFLRQIPQNYWLALILGLRGHVNPANVSIRQIIELFLKHLYFLHHPVEHGWVQRDDGIKEFGFHMLSEYANRLHEFNDFTERAGALSTLGTVFSEASRFVHVHNSKFFGREALGKTKSECIHAATSVGASLEKIGPIVSVLSIIYQYDLFPELGGTEQRLIMSGWSAKSRAAFVDWKRKRDLAQRQH